MNQKTIKSFIYLDDYKLYSLSSQLFEGFTEYIISDKSSIHTEEISQKGQFASGKVMGDILSKKANSTEKKYLHDYAFNLLEKELGKNNIIYDISSNDTIESIRSKGIIRITGKATINDYNMVDEVLSNYNDIGNAIGYFQYQNILKNQSNSQSNLPSSSRKVKNKKSIQDQQFTAFVKEQGLNIPIDTAKYVHTIIEYGFRGNLEFRIIPKEESLKITAILSREYLRDTEPHFLSKYSRNTEFDFTLVGIITQADNKGTSDINNDIIPSSLRDVFIYLGSKLGLLEKAFMGEMKNECIVDPLAIYRNL